MTMLAEEIHLEIDPRRTISVYLTDDRASIVLGVEDPNTVAVVELTRSETKVLIDALQKALA